jgi:hypothetical protein
VTVGVIVGAALGVLVGEDVGATVGVIVGATLGALVGEDVGVTVGITVGTGLAAIEGVSVGRTVGLKVGGFGAFVGLLLCAPVGFAVGECDGELV